MTEAEETRPKEKALINKASNKLPFHYFLEVEPLSQQEENEARRGSFFIPGINGRARCLEDLDIKPPKTYSRSQNKRQDVRVITDLKTT
jgi:hypothetical protein